MLVGGEVREGQSLQQPVLCLYTHALCQETLQKSQMITWPSVFQRPRLFFSPQAGILESLASSFLDRDLQQ